MAASLKSFLLATWNWLLSRGNVKSPLPLASHKVGRLDNFQTVDDRNTNPNCTFAVIFISGNAAISLDDERKGWESSRALFTTCCPDVLSLVCFTFAEIESF